MDPEFFSRSLQWNFVCWPEGVMLIFLVTLQNEFFQRKGWLGNRSQFPRQPLSILDPSMPYEKCMCTCMKMYLIEKKVFPYFFVALSRVTSAVVAGALSSVLIVTGTGSGSFLVICFRSLSPRLWGR